HDDAHVDELETERLDPVDDPVQCGLVRELRLEHGDPVCGRDVEALEGGAKPRTGLTLEGDLVGRYRHRCRLRAGEWESAECDIAMGARPPRRRGDSTRISQPPRRG